MLLRQYAESCLQTVLRIRNKLSLKTQKSNRRKKKLKRRKNFAKGRFNIDESAFGCTAAIKGHKEKRFNSNKFVLNLLFIVICRNEINMPWQI